MNRRWICTDVWMDILPSFDYAQLGLKMALLSPRFELLVDKHFDGKTEFTIWRLITICNDIEIPKLREIPKLFVDGKSESFPVPNNPLPNKIRFRHLQIKYIDHSVIEFLRSNKQIWDRKGTEMELAVHSDKTAESDDHQQQIWDVLAHEIWPIFSASIRHLSFQIGDHLDNLRRLISLTILTDSIQLNSIDSDWLFPDGIADDGPNATAGQALSQWLHTPTKNGQPKRLHCDKYFGPRNLEWVNNFKETFRRATTSVSYTIQLYFWEEPTPTEQFELVNEETNEKLTLKLSKELVYNNYLCNWLLKRCPIGETATAPIKFVLEHGNYSGANLNNIRFDMWGGNHCIGPLSPPAEEEEADQSK